ncbi:MAG: hypothetical protein WBA51_06035 [Erythrobacter sp.]
MLRRVALAAAALLMTTGCSASTPDQAAIDAAVDKALAERDREDAAKYRQSQAAADESALSAAAEAGAVRSAEPLRAGLSKELGSAYGMCIRTLSIVGENCGCMVNRATDAGIADARQAKLFGGRAGNATPDEIARFTRIVRACSGYNITVRGEPGETAQVDQAKTALSRPASGGRVVTCEFENERYGYEGNCRFVAGSGGDFQATSLEGNYFEDVSRIDLDVTSRNAGHLIINYTTGPVEVPVKRELQDKACWSNESVRFCAR